jgi:hypothetical protein
VAPKSALLLAIPYALINFVSLKMQTTSDIFENSPLFFLKISVLAQILNLGQYKKLYRVAFEM